MTTATRPHAVPASLDRARRLLGPALRTAVDTLAPEVRLVAAYHLGLMDRDGREVTGDGGKAVRPALAFLSAEAVGSSAETARPGALAVELVHNFSLLHDDVMDRDLERRHRPTAWALFGVPEAIVAGDALEVLAHRVLLGLGSEESMRAAAALAEATDDMIAGQAEDLSFASRPDVSIEQCLAMCAHKTGALLSCASSIGAILAGADPPKIAALRAFGLHLGLAFQAMDDILGIWGLPEVTGKPVAGDLREHKKTLPVVAALASAGARDRERLRALLEVEAPTEEQLGSMVDLLEACGGRAWTAGEANRQLSGALSSLESAELHPPAADQLAEIARFVAEREF